MPKDGIERSKYLEIKFGGKKNAQPIYDRMTEEAKKEGLNFNLDDIKKTPNTALSHLLINLGEKEKKQNILNKEGLRFKDEFVRHKILDSIGDLYLAGYPVEGYFYGKKSGHSLNKALLKKLLSNKENFEII